MKLRYLYRLRPGRVAERALLREEGRNRWVWNQATAARRAGLPRFDDKALTAARREHDWLRKGSVVAQQQTLRDFHQSTTSYRRNFRRKHASRTSLNYTLRGFSLREIDGALRLVVAGRIVLPVVWSRELPADPTSVRVYQDNVGHWWASFVVDVETELLPKNNNAIGIDWGISEIATTTDRAYDLPHPQLSRKHAAQLAAAQRRMARRRPERGKPASKGYRQAKKQAAVIHEHVKNSRREHARLWARRIVADHQFIAVEDFRPAFLAKSTMAKKAADAAVGMTKRILTEYAERGGRQVVNVNPAYTTMDCSACGTRATTRLSLSQRVFNCTSCNIQLGRDLNAARNILARAGNTPAGIDGIRHQPDRLTGLVGAA